MVANVNYTIEPQYATHDIHGNELSDKEREELRSEEFQLEPFVKTNWKSAVSRDEWSPVLQKAARAKTTAEWKSVSSDLTDRKAAIIHVNHQSRDKWLQRVGEHDLHYRHIRNTRPYQGYSHKVMPAEPNDPKRISYSVIAENADIADKMEEAENEMSGVEKHRTVGELLGFPDCCLDFFADVWIHKNRIDPMYEIACNSGNAEMIDNDPQQIRITDPEPWSNILYRYFGWSFITHLPCSFDCQESHEIAKARGEIMAENGYRDVANDLHLWLSQPMEWSGYKAQVRVSNDHMLGAAQTDIHWNKKRIVWGEEPEPESVQTPGPEE